MISNFLKKNDKGLFKTFIKAKDYIDTNVQF